MDISISMRKFLKARRDRTVGAILGFLEESLRESMTDEQWEDTRQVVIGAVNSYHDTVLDLMRSDDDTLRNDHVVELMEKVEQHLRREAQLKPSVRGPIGTGI